VSHRPVTGHAPAVTYGTCVCRHQPLYFLTNSSVSGPRMGLFSTFRNINVQDGFMFGSVTPAPWMSGMSNLSGTPLNRRSPPSSMLILVRNVFPEVLHFRTLILLYFRNARTLGKTGLILTFRVRNINVKPVSFRVGSIIILQECPLPRLLGPVLDQSVKPVQNRK